MTTDKKNAIIVKIDPELEDLIPQFMENTRKDIDAIVKALSENDLGTVRRIGHSMKSYGSGYGFDDISKTGKAIEGAALSNNLSAVSECVNALTNYLNQVKVVYAE
ncbi:MAG: Hpt domain-containing protein [Deltaproteobacteria bacterium HGW-Deltaproteobacteria-7]|jgi:HPt (histidine-containing phosphotransfer) domain-containing protein|nr:MAG: Hpt domain-containing protein [Deltaproteobacteria bacterium HGW-Deltaproteobacteria-7]PKN18829.1 MAG: Hpt domain-containing protein [Deltaproteobacteria bacterium HGW-Deltaproteobacteria-6]